MLSLILLKKILSLYLILLAGAVLVKTGMLKADAGKVLSVINMFLIAPCTIFGSFQIDRTPELLKGMFLSLIAATLLTYLNILIARILRKPLHLNVMEEVSIGFPNAGNMVIPLVTAVFGAEWVVYTMTYIVMQNITIWIYADTMIRGEKKVNWKKIIRNPNILTIIVSLILFAFKIKMPAVLTDAVSSVGDMVGPVSMLVTGIIIGNMDLKSAVSSARNWMVCGLRLIVLPLVALPILKLLTALGGHPDAETIFTITMMSEAAGCFASGMQLATLYGRDNTQACAVNVMSTLLCVVSLPVMIWLYRL